MDRLNFNKVTVTINDTLTYWDSLDIAFSEPEKTPKRKKKRGKDAREITVKSFIPIERRYCENRAARRDRRFGRE